MWRSTLIVLPRYEVCCCLSRCELRASYGVARPNGHHVRELVVIVVLALGAVTGLLSALNDDWGTRIAMVAMGVLFAAPLGAAIAFLFRAHPARTRNPSAHRMTGEGTSAADLAANYPRDRGHPPFMKPPEGPPDKHQFDPERIV